LESPALAVPRRSKSFVSLVAVLLLGWSSSVRSETPPDDPPELVLGWRDPHGLCAVAEDVVRAEMQRVLGTLGVRTRWLNQPEHEGSEAVPGAADAVDILLLDQSPDNWGLPEHTLGAVRGPEASRSTLFVFVRNILRYTHRRLDPHQCLQRRARNQVGRAVARVIVHELVHLIAPEHPHAGFGLMRAHLGWSELLSRGWELDPVCARLFVLALG